MGWDEDGVVDLGLVVRAGTSLSVIPNPTGAPGAAAVLSVNSQSWEVHTMPAFILAFAPVISYLPWLI